MSSLRLNAVSAFLLLVSLLLFSPQPALSFGLKSNVQNEIDQNPFLQKEGIKLRVTDEKNGYVTIEMYEGDFSARQRIKNGFPVSKLDTYASEAGSGNKLQETARALQLTMEALQKVEGVKSIMLTAAIDTPRDKANKIGFEAAELLKQKNYSAVIEKCNIALETDPTHSWSYSMRGSSYASLKDNAKAVSDYNKAIKYNPKNVKAYYGLALISLNSDNREQYLIYLENALKVDPDNLQTLEFLVFEYANQKKSAKVCEVLSKALSLGFSKEAISGKETFQFMQNEPCFQKLMLNK
jgi:tetratricopeptide (TPR) repeat protein